MARRLTRRALFGDRENTDNEKYARTGLRARPRAARRIDDVWRDVGGVRDGDVVSVVPAEKTLTPDVDQVMIGTMAKPALQIEGLPVAVTTTAFHVRVTVSGPIVPVRDCRISPKARRARGPSR